MPRTLVIRVVRPGHVIVACGSRNVAELRGGQLSDFTLDIFQSQWLPALFEQERRALVAEYLSSGRAPLDADVAATLSAHLGRQMIKRVIATIRASHHGGTVIVGPPTAWRSASCRSSTPSAYSPARRRYRALPARDRGDRRGGRGPPSDPEVYLHDPHGHAAELDEGLFETSHLIAALAQVDGAVLLTKRFEVLGFGAEIAGSLPLIHDVRRGLDLEATRLHRGGRRRGHATPIRLSPVRGGAGHAGHRGLAGRRGALRDPAPRGSHLLGSRRGRLMGKPDRRRALPGELARRDRRRLAVPRHGRGRAAPAVADVYRQARPPIGEAREFLARAAEAEGRPRTGLDRARAHASSPGWLAASAPACVLPTIASRPMRRSQHVPGAPGDRRHVDDRGRAHARTRARLAPVQGNRAPTARRSGASRVVTSRRRQCATRRGPGRERRPLLQPEPRDGRGRSDDRPPDDFDDGLRRVARRCVLDGPGGVGERHQRARAGRAPIRSRRRAGEAARRGAAGARLIYEAKGLTATEAKDVSAELMKNEKSALDALSREELGIDPTELGGSAWIAASTSFLLFSLGAIIPVAPYLFSEGHRATVFSVAAGGLGLFAIGAAISLFTGRSAWFSGGRQVLLGFAAAAVTYGIVTSSASPSRVRRRPGITEAIVIA